MTNQERILRVAFFAGAATDALAIVPTDFSRSVFVISDCSAALRANEVTAELGKSTLS